MSYEFRSDHYLGLVSHVKRSPKSEMTSMQIRLNVSTRAGIVALAQAWDMSQLAVIRVALTRFLQENLADLTAPVAGPGAPSPVPGLVPVVPEPVSVAEVETVAAPASLEPTASEHVMTEPSLEHVITEPSLEHVMTEPRKPSRKKS